MKSAPAGKPPPKRRRRSLVDVWFGDLQMAKHDLTPPPPVKLREKLHPIQHSSPN